MKKAEFEGEYNDIDGDFFERVIESDSGMQLYNVIWEQYTTAIRSLMNNPYVFQPYWDYVNKKISADDWKESFDAAKRRAHQALAEQDTVTSFSIVMGRMYTLRNQILHGGATYQGGLNREQIKDACSILGTVVPIVINLMMRNGTAVWGDAAYF